MVYGALVGFTTAPRRYKLVKVLPSVRVLTRVSQTTAIKMPNENTPLIIQRRVRRNRSRETILNWKIICLLMILVLGVFIGIHLLVNEYKEWPTNYPFHLVDRSLWNNEDPFANSSLLNTSSVSNIVLSHTRSDFCHNYITCVDVISKMQNQSVPDIPFNFLIGGDGKTYELRGWNYLSGFDDLPYNNESIHVGLIGDFTFIEPRKHQVEEVNALISESIRRRKLSPDFKVLGTRGSKLDGLKMFEQLKTLERWDGWI